MAKETINNLKLGIFISVGLFILIISLYVIGRNQSYFGSNFHVRARFANAAGLMPGNNVRFDGIQAGTVKEVNVLDDTTIEVDMVIDKSMRAFVHHNTLAAIGNEGLIGNKVVNLSPNSAPGPLVNDGELLQTKRAPETEEMMKTFSSTNMNVNKISESLVTTLDKFNNGAAFWSILNDTSIPRNLSASMANMRSLSVKLDELTQQLSTTVSDVRNGKGTAGLLLEDQKTQDNVKQTIDNLKKASQDAADAVAKTDSLMRMVQHDYATGHGPAQAMLKDSAMVGKLNRTLTNVEKGTLAFSQDMEALKHNFLTRRYFKKQAKSGADTTK